MFPLPTMTQNKIEIDLKGKQFEMSPLVLADLANMQQWFKELPLQKCKAELKEFGEMYEDKKKRKLVNKAHETYTERSEVIDGKDIDIDLKKKVKEDMNTEFCSLDGIGRMLWLSLKKTQPDITLEQVASMIDLDSLVSIRVLLDSLMFAPKPDSCDEKKTTEGDGEI